MGLFDIFLTKSKSPIEFNFKKNINDIKKIKGMPIFADSIVITTQWVAIDFLKSKSGKTLLPCENLLKDISNDILLFEVSAWFMSATKLLLKNSSLIPNEYRSVFEEQFDRAQGKMGEIFETVGNFKNNLFKKRVVNYPSTTDINTIIPHYFLKIILQEIGLKEPVSTIGEIPLKLLLSDSHYDLEQRCKIFYTAMFDGGFQAITNCITHVMKESQKESLDRKFSIPEEVESPALKEFERELSGWPPEQAKIALLLIKAVLERKGKDVKDIAGKLTIGQLNLTSEVVKKMFEEDKNRKKIV